MSVIFRHRLSLHSVIRYFYWHLLLPIIIISIVCLVETKLLANWGIHIDP